MRKICDEFWKTVNPAYACINELVVLPENGDCGFVEYFEYKAERIIDEKKIFSSFAPQNKTYCCRYITVWYPFTTVRDRHGKQQRQDGTMMRLSEPSFANLISAKEPSKGRSVKQRDE